MPWDIEEWRKEKEKRRTIEVRTPGGEREFWGPPKKRYPKPDYPYCNKGHLLQEVYDEKRDAFVWDCPTCIARQGKNPTFEEWKKRADDAAVRRAGISLDDLADQPYYDWYEDGMSPEKAAKRALAAEGFPL